MEELLTSWWGILVTVSGGLAVIIAFVKAIENIREWINKKAKERVARDNMEYRIMSAIDDLDKNMQKTDKIQMQRIDELIERIERIDATLVDVQEQSTALTYDKLMAAYTKHGVRREPITVSALASLQRIYAAYSKNGRNHIPTDFLERLDSCPIDK